ncbi:DUF1778 domain-containing protein [Aeromonas caviae]|uniref:type II toxin-antitoxin system TacA family antitoxin n=1 Tax=Aeromonas caviae TaxID=648 RepID=UPI001165C21B|nr:DUF1778 domain-containing protein [Aeromonas caviae]QDO76826.1 DUF1778 domain-containing protein [Aeromonas caviae]
MNNQHEIHLNISESEYLLLKKAKAILGVSLTDFIITTCLAQANALVKQHGQITLTQEEHEQIEALMRNPPPMTDCLKDAIERSRSGIIEINTTKKNGIKK